MKTALLIHGMPSKASYYNEIRDAQSNSHWFPWLQQQLLINDVLTQSIEMPRPYAPVYEEWKKMFEQFDVNENTILVGHSCGGGFLVRWLSESEVKVGTVVLVAPWLDLEQSLDTGMFDFTIKESLAQQVANFHLIYSTDDDIPMLETAQLLTKKLPTMQVHEFSDKQHFTLNDMGTVEFPELRDIILGS